MGASLTLTTRNLPIVARITNADAIGSGPTVGADSPWGQKRSKSPEEISRLV